MSSKSTFSNSTSKSYALALYELAKENSDLPKVEEGMKAIDKLIRESSDCDGILSSITDIFNETIILKLSSKIKIISNFAVGFGNIDVKAAAKRKFDVYPSAYANAYASKICAGKIKDPSGEMLGSEGFQNYIKKFQDTPSNERLKNIVEDIVKSGKIQKDDLTIVVVDGK